MSHNFEKYLRIEMVLQHFIHICPNFPNACSPVAVAKQDKLSPWEMKTNQKVME